MATTQLSRSISSTGNQRTATFSAWVKKCNPTKDTQSLISFAGSHEVYMHNAGLRWNDGTGNFLYTNALQRDVSGWYHIMVAIDTTQGTESDRVKFYINGEHITSLLNSSYPDEDEDLPMNVSSTTNYIGNNNSGTGYLEGAMSHVYWIDGLAYAPTVFGSTDADSGEWKINTSPSVTYGNNGFLILKDGNTITDQGSNSNNFTLDSGTLTDLQDCPDDVFATMNPLAYPNIAGGTYSNGNNTWVTGNSYYTYTPATLAVTKGKFYWEVEYDAKSGGTEQPMVGITSTQSTASTHALGYYANDWAYYMGNTTSYSWNNNSGTAYGDTYTVGDIISVALDADNNKLYFAKNGTWQNSGDPTSGATGTGAISITAPASTPLGAYFPAVCFYSSSENGTFHTNFGNGIFGTTSITDEGTNAAGIGKFEYDVPTGYTALSAKGLNN